MISNTRDRLSLVGDGDDDCVGNGVGDGDGDVVVIARLTSVSAPLHMTPLIACILPPKTNLMQLFFPPKISETQPILSPNNPNNTWHSLQVFGDQQVLIRRKFFVVKMMFS